MSNTTILLCDDFNHVVIEDAEKYFSEDGLVCYVHEPKEFTIFGIDPITELPFESQICGKELHHQEFYHPETDEVGTIVSYEED
jgi:hypothetical protein